MQDSISNSQGFIKGRKNTQQSKRASIQEDGSTTDKDYYSRLEEKMGWTNEQSENLNPLTEEAELMF